jgi:hypothetical protein
LAERTKELEAVQKQESLFRELQSRWVYARLIVHLDLDAVNGSLFFLMQE